MQTKRNMRMLSVLPVVILCATMLTACGGSKLNGTYRSQGFISQSFTFDGDQVTMSARNTPGSSPFHSRKM